MRLVLNSSHQKANSMMPVENWDGAETRGVSAGLGCRLPYWPGWRAAALPVCSLKSALWLDPKWVSLGQLNRRLEAMGEGMWYVYIKD